MKEKLIIPRKAMHALKITRNFHDYIIQTMLIDCTSNDCILFHKQCTKKILLRVKDKWDSTNTYNIQFNDVDSIDIHMEDCQVPELTQWIYKFEIIQEESSVKITYCDSLLDKNCCSTVIIKARSLKINHTNAG